MSLLGIIETLRRNLKAVIAVCWIVLALVIVADVVRLATSGEPEAATSEHTAAPTGEHSAAPAAEHSAHAAAPAEHAAPTEHAPAHVASEASAKEGGFWASAYHIAENTPVFWTLFGFLGCVLIVVVSKTYGHLGVSEREDYYSE